MHDLLKDARELSTVVEEAITRLNIAALEKRLAKIKDQTADPKIWQDQTNAAKLMKQLADLELRIKPWRELQANINDTVDLAKTADESLHADLAKQLVQANEAFNICKSRIGNN